MRDMVQNIGAWTIKALGKDPAIRLTPACLLLSGFLFLEETPSQA